LRLTKRGSGKPLFGPVANSGPACVAATQIKLAAIVANAVQQIVHTLQFEFMGSWGRSATAQTIASQIPKAAEMTRRACRLPLISFLGKTR
jgi:hypothetical protein